VLYESVEQLEKSRMEALERKRAVRVRGSCLPTTSESGLATATPASAVLGLGFTPVNGHTTHNQPIASTA